MTKQLLLFLNVIFKKGEYRDTDETQILQIFPKIKCLFPLSFLVEGFIAITIFKYSTNLKTYKFLIGSKK